MAITAPTSPVKEQTPPAALEEKPTPGEARISARAYAAGMNSDTLSADQKSHLTALQVILEKSSPATEKKVKKRFQAEVHAELQAEPKRARQRRLHLSAAEDVGLPLPMYVPEQHVIERHLSGPGKYPLTSSQGVVISWKHDKPTTSFPEGMGVGELKEMIALSTPVAKAGSRSERKSPTGLSLICLGNDTPVTAHTAYPIFFQDRYVKDATYSILNDGSLMLDAETVRTLAIRAIENYKTDEDRLKRKNPIINSSDKSVTVDIAGQIEQAKFGYNIGIRFIFPIDELSHVEDFALKANWH